MGLQVWLPLTKDLRNQGLSNISIVNEGATKTTNGKVGDCYNLTGGPITLSNIPNPQNISISFWFKRTATTNTRQFFFTAWEGITCELGTDNYVICSVKSNNSQVGVCRSTSAFTVDSGWTHLTYTFQNSVGTKLYLNGTLVSSASLTTPISWNTTVGKLGQYSTFASASVLMNDFRIYDETLSATDIHKIASGLTCHYPLTNEGFGGTNLLLGTSLEPSEFGQIVASFSKDWAHPVCTYNGHNYFHSFSDGIDTITLGSAGNVGIAFTRKASDIKLDSNSNYTNKYRYLCFYLSPLYLIL